MSKDTTIISKVFINESWYQDDDKKAGIKAGTKKPLSLSWREATLQADGTYLVRAFLQIAGEEKAQDITGNVFFNSATPNVFASQEAVEEHLKGFEDCAAIHGNDTYDGKIDK